MAKYIRKPEVVDAVQWFPGVKHDKVECPIVQGGRYYEGVFGPCGMVLGVQIITPGEWIIELEDGELMTCSDQCFKDQYIAISDGAIIKVEAPVRFSVDFV
jgi:hypothetical protein